MQVQFYIANYAMHPLFRQAEHQAQVLVHGQNRHQSRPSLKPTGTDSSTILSRLS